MPPLAAGRLPHRATHQRRTAEANAIGEDILTWSTLKARWFNIQPAAGTETDEADKNTARVSYTAEARDALSASLYQQKDRLVWRGRTLEVVAVLPSPHDGYCILHLAQADAA